MVKIITSREEAQASSIAALREELAATKADLEAEKARVKQLREENLKQDCVLDGVKCENEHLKMKLATLIQM